MVVVGLGSVATLREEERKCEQNGEKEDARRKEREQENAMCRGR